MTALSKTSAKALFETGDRPTQTDFGDLIDSYQDAAANLGTLSSASLGGFGLTMLATNTTAAAQSLLGTVTVSAPTLYQPVLRQPDIVGVTDGSNANSGSVGQMIESEISAGAAVSLTNNQVANVATIALSPGDWDVWGNISMSVNAATIVSAYAASISTISSTHASAPNGGAYTQFGVTTLAGAISPHFIVGQKRMVVSTSTNAFLTGSATFSVNTASMYGYIGARRRR